MRFPGGYLDGRPRVCVTLGFNITHAVANRVFVHCARPAAVVRPTPTRRARFAYNSTSRARNRNRSLALALDGAHWIGPCVSRGRLMLHHTRRTRVCGGSALLWDCNHLDTPAGIHAPCARARSARLGGAAACMIHSRPKLHPARRERVFLLGHPRARRLLRTPDRDHRRRAPLRARGVIGFSPRSRTRAGARAGSRFPGLITRTGATGIWNTERPSRFPGLITRAQRVFSLSPSLRFARRSLALAKALLVCITYAQGRIRICIGWPRPRTA